MVHRVRTRVRFISALLLTVAIGCGTTEASPSTSPFSSSGPASPTAESPVVSVDGTYNGHGITFEYPASWTEVGPLGPDDTAWEATFGPKGSGYVSYVAYETDGSISGSALREFGDAFFEFVKSDALGDVQVGGMESTTVGGVPAYRVEFGSLAGYKSAAVFSRGPTAYAFSCFLENDPAVESTEPCDHALESFEFTQS